MTSGSQLLLISQCSAPSDLLAEPSQVCMVGLASCRSLGMDVATGLRTPFLDR